MRGIHDGLIGWAKLPRFTPAHAGNTSSATYIKRSGWVHPRSRGEYKSDAHNLSGLRGSPPLTRGILFQMEQMSMSMRFTPAHAGNTRLFFLKSCLPEGHPRSRGEYQAEEDPERFWQGSPPLTRGILPGRRQIQSGLRFTPAHAGNTWKVGRWNKPGLVHPRSRGEYLPLIRWRAREIGSPPLTRGIHFSGSPGSKRHRFTPAHAGNTFAVMQKKALR